MPPDNRPEGANNQEPTGGTTSVETEHLIRSADEILAREGITISSSKRSRLVRKYQRNADRTHSLRDFLLANCADGHRRWAVGGSDPTATRAIQNVDPRPAVDHSLAGDNRYAAIESAADLGLGYPPVDRTDDLVGAAIETAPELPLRGRELIPNTEVRN